MRNASRCSLLLQDLHFAKTSAHFLLCLCRGNHPGDQCTSLCRSRLETASVGVAEGTDQCAKTTEAQYPCDPVLTQVRIVVVRILHRVHDIEYGTRHEGNLVIMSDIPHKT